MKNKYYTPTRDELHIGFEIEISNFNKVADNKYNTVWNKLTINGFDDLAQILLYPTEIIRVKYLDKEDIESLGFKEFESLKRTVYDQMFNFDNRFYIGKNFNTTFLKIMSPNGYSIFEGIVNNKSEFKRLLKQLNIL